MTHTADGAFVADLSGMCADHDQQALWMIVQALDVTGIDTRDPLAEARQYLAEERAACLEQCGRATLAPETEAL